MAGRSEQQDGSRFGSVATMVAWIGAGAVLVAGGALAVGSVVDLPLSRTVLGGLGIALGGGIGAVGYIVSVDDIEHPETDRPAETVELDDEEIPAPEPIDLFGGHPDPILYYTDEGYGPVVRAANEAFGATFDVPTARIAGTPLGETLMAVDSAAIDTAAVADDEFEATNTFETATGHREYRLRSVGDGDDGYLLYTPLEP
ncbi:hypothetical protein [Haloarcula pelagica]|uniref:hypothetical protein n=1 Tax=Haloarcula pelagica TaxID=3033389 RepID=UPI0024C2BC77|nr:hypothetical protein [Halomicroarcula sp. YJ-61-S]